MTDVIWLNERLKYRGKVLFFKDWIDKGVLFVDQVYSETVKNAQDLRAIAHNRPHFVFQYNALYNALVRKTIEVNQNPVHWLTLNGHLLKHATTKFVRSVLVNRESVTLHCEQFWTRKYPLLMNWRMIWKYPFLILKDARARQLQWKITHGIYATNTLLCKMRLSRTSTCSFCPELDTIEHFFCNCIVCTPLWNLVEGICLKHYGVRLILSETEKLFGYKLETDTYVYLNKLILIAKVCISKFKKWNYANLVILFENECHIRNILL